MKNNKRAISKINRLLEMPQEVYTDTPKITITGFNEMIIENFKGILEYEDYYIRINTSLGIININGYELSLENINIYRLPRQQFWNIILSEEICAFLRKHVNRRDKR